MNPEGEIEAARVTEAVSVEALDHPAWERARDVHLTRYWSGAEAPESRHAAARLIWTDEAVSVRFVCRQIEPLVVATGGVCRDRKTLNLWERDVCEIFLAPDVRAPERYFEFEAAPTGEWIDLRIDMTGAQRATGWDFHSGMRAAARVAEGEVVIAMSIPWPALIGGEAPPAAGTRWRTNLFRCVGAGPGRGYLAWQPTRTPQPDFHVPEAFGLLTFKP